jgi:hypothetical protein
MRSGGRPTRIQREQDPFTGGSRRAGCHRPHAHRFRHTLGTQLAEKGARILTIMRVAGHKSPGMSMTDTSISHPTVLADYQAMLQPRGGPIDRDPGDGLGGGVAAGVDRERLARHRGVTLGGAVGYAGRRLARHGTRPLGRAPPRSDGCQPGGHGHGHGLPPPPWVSCEEFGQVRARSKVQL